MTIAKQLAAGLPDLEGAVSVAVAPLESDAKTSRPAALAVLVGTQLAGQGGWRMASSDTTSPSAIEPVSVAEAIAQARGARWLVYARTRIEHGRLRATADLHPVPSTVWARARNPSPGPVAHVFAEAGIDAEVRSFLQPIPLVSAFDFARGRNFELGVLAVACDDFDHDGAPEIVSVSRSAVTLSRIRDGKVAPIASKLWSDLSPSDPTPLREPIAAAFSVPAREEGAALPIDLVVSLTDRARSARIGAGFVTTSSFGGFAVPEGGALACARLPSLWITGPLERCDEGDPTPKRKSVTGRYDAYASASLVDESGAPFEVWAGREDGAVEIRDDTGKFARIASAGAQLAVGDLDQDGAPEILTSLDVERGTPDAVVLYTWDRAAKSPPKERIRIPVAAGVHALAVCPATGSGRVPFVVATGGEVLVAR